MHRSPRSGSRLALEAQEHDPGGGQDDEGDDEKKEAKLQQRGAIDSVRFLNSLAIVAEIVVAGDSKDAAIVCELPITKVTAIVSPRARPRPSITPPTTPTLA